jgi:hypothetical protein
MNEQKWALVAQGEGAWGPFDSHEECEKLLERDAAITGDTRAEQLVIMELTAAKALGEEIWPVADFISYLEEEEGN